MGPRLALNRALFNEWTDAGGDLRLFLGPEGGLPFANEIAIGVDPFPGIRLLAPQIEQEHAMAVVNPEDDVHRVVATARRHGVVRPAVHTQGGWRIIDVWEEPLILKIAPNLDGRFLLVESCPILRRGIGFGAGERSLIELFRPQRTASWRNGL